MKPGHDTDQAASEQSDAMARLQKLGPGKETDEKGTTGDASVARRRRRSKFGIDDEMIFLLLSWGWTYEPTAKLAGCSTTTVGRRMADPEFAERVRRGRQADIAANSALRSQLAELAPRDLAELVFSEDATVAGQAGRMFMELGHRRNRAARSDIIWI